MFKLPIPFNENTISNFKPESPEALKKINSYLMIIDEGSSISKFALNAIDEVLRRLMKKNEIFGGKIILLGGDFRQTANVIMRGWDMNWEKDPLKI